MYSTTIVSNELAIPERWSLDRAFDIYAQIYAHFLKKTPFSTIFYNFLKIAKSLYIKGFQTICGNVAMDYNVAKESPIDYKVSLQIYDLQRFFCSFAKNVVSLPTIELLNNKSE